MSLLVGAVVAERCIGENDGAVAVFAQVGRHAAGMDDVGEIREVLSIPEIPQTIADPSANTDEPPQVILLYDTP